MNENPQETQSNADQTTIDWREERHHRREERRASRAGSAWLGGAFLILIGIVLMLQNMGALTFTNWWALFILLPGLASFGTAWKIYQDAGGSLTASARSSLIAGLVLTMISAIFLFELNWSYLGPLVLILAGLGLLLNTFLPK